jgi:hypothetical protein
MQLKLGLLDYSKPWTLPDVYLFTGNPIKKKNGAIVMGRGAAKQVRDSYPGIDVVMGRMIKPNMPLAWASVTNHQFIGWFQVKHHWRAEADVGLIERSAHALAEVAEKRPEITFHLNFPGVGNGGLGADQVLPIIENALPDNVLVYK